MGAIGFSSCSRGCEVKIWRKCGKRKVMQERNVGTIAHKGDKTGCQLPVREPVVFTASSPSCPTIHRTCVWFPCLLPQAQLVIIDMVGTSPWAQSTKLTDEALHGQQWTLNSGHAVCTQGEQRNETKEDPFGARSVTHPGWHPFFHLEQLKLCCAIALQNGAFQLVY